MDTISKAITDDDLKRVSKWAENPHVKKSAAEYITNKGISDDAMMERILEAADLEIKNGHFADSIRNVFSRK